MRRRQRRLRQFLRHEQLTVAMALAEATHHVETEDSPASAITVNDAPRGQENADAEYFELSSEEEMASARSMRPAPLWEPRPQERIQRHTAEQMIESFVPVPMLDLDAPVPQLVDQLVVVLQGLDMFTPVEQGIEVPKITLEDWIPQRAVLREPLPVEQLADVPVPETVILARGSSGTTSLRGGAELLVDGWHTTCLVAPPGGFTARRRVVFKYWAPW